MSPSGGGVNHGREMGHRGGDVSYPPVFDQLTLSETETLVRHALNARTFPACTAVLCTSKPAETPLCTYRSRWPAAALVLAARGRPQWGTNGLRVSANPSGAPQRTCCSRESGSSCRLGPGQAAWSRLQWRVRRRALSLQPSHTGRRGAVVVEGRRQLHRGQAPLSTGAACRLLMFSCSVPLAESSRYFA